MQTVFERLKCLRAFPPLYSIAMVSGKRVAVVAPHPDDEVIGAGGAIALHAARGDDVAVVIMTDGAGGDPSDHERGKIIAVRRAESLAAGSVLGVARHRFLGLTDGAVTPGETTISVLAGALAEERCDLVYAPSPFECHPDHLATALAAASACARLEPVPRLHFFEVNQQHVPSYLLDITPAVSTKAAALRCFRSQMAYVDLVAKTLGHNVGRAVNVSDLNVTHIEGFLIAPRGDLAILMEPLLNLLEKIERP